MSPPEVPQPTAATADALACRAQALATPALQADFQRDGVTKAGGTRQPTRWHQDQPCCNVDGHQNLSFWIPVDPVSRAATLEFVAGAHRGPWRMPCTRLSHEARWFPEGSLAELPDIDADRSRFNILGWALAPGDAVAFHMLALHASGGVEPGRRRRVFSARYLGDDMRHAPRPWATSPNFPGLADRLPAGAPLDDPLFPLVWDSPATGRGQHP